MTDIFSPDLRVITLFDQLDWAEKCLQKMKESGRPCGEVALQESICLTLRDRIRDKGALVAAGINL